MPNDSTIHAGAPSAVPVLVPLPAEGPYTYALAEGMVARPGMIVAVPLGPRMVPGIVWDGAPGQVDRKKLRRIAEVFDCPPVNGDLRRFIDWVAAYTLTPPGLVARMVLRVPAAFEPEPFSKGIRVTGHKPQRMTDARRRVMDLAADGYVWTRSGLAEGAGVTPSVIDGLVAAGAFETLAVPPQPVVAPPDPEHGRAEFEPDQAEAAARLRTLFDDDTPKPLLIDGVTGSGKTEVYFEAVAEAVRRGRQALVLLPEIALTETMRARFEARFGARPAEWHSDVPPRQRERVWRQVAEGTVKVVVGARSALFLPFPDLGLIVVDEEHDPAFKQQEGVTYHARDMAVVRGALSRFPVVLASATPSIESRVNAARGRYGLVRLTARYGDAALPSIAAIDMRKSPPPRGRFLSPLMAKAVQDTVARGEQALLFLNRRGYAPLTLCRACGHRFQCSDCSAWLVEHRFRGQLQCHHCGHHEKVPEACPECGALDHLTACGPGVERVAEEAVDLFPEARVIVLSSDMMGGVKRLRLELEAIAKGEADIIIGTQLVAKGHNFPLLTLVGVVDADLGLANGDPRAAERTFQLLAQVTGRAGRFGLSSRGLIQTWQPQHPVMAALVSGEREAFYDSETAMREQAFLPPFSRLAALIVSGEDRGETEAHAKALRRAAPAAGDIAVLGPAEAPLALVRGRHRFRLAVQATRNADIQGFVQAMLAAAPRPRGSVRVQVDIDPMSFF